MIFITHRQLAELQAKSAQLRAAIAAAEPECARALVNIRIVITDAEPACAEAVARVRQTVAAALRKPA